jgi:diacylglycerol kinase family enzyme
MGNDLYRTLHGSIPRNLQFKKVLSQDRRVVDVFSCNGLRFSVAFGVGFDGQVTYYVARLRNKRIPRLLSYWVSVLMNLRSFKEVQLETSFGTFDTFLLSISNTPYVGGGFKIAPEAIIDDRLVDMIHIGKISFLGRISNLLKVRTGKHLGIAEVSHQKISAIKIQCDRELYAHLDGELIQSKSYDIRFARKLEFLV